MTKLEELVNEERRKRESTMTAQQIIADRMLFNELQSVIEEGFTTGRGFFRVTHEPKARQ